jgi:hypothetical protein
MRKKQFIITISGYTDDIADELEQIAELIRVGTTVGSNSRLHPTNWQFISKEEVPVNA